MEHNARVLVEEFQRMGIESEVLSINQVGKMGPLLAWQGIKVRGIGYSGKWGWRSAGALRRALRGTIADGLVMVGHNLMAMLAMGNRFSEHRVLSIHYHHKGVKPNWQWRAIYRVAACQFTAIAFVSQYIMSEAINIAPWLSRRSLMVSTPVRLPSAVTQATRAAARQRLGIPASAKVVGNAGWLVPRKRWDVFLDVAARVAPAVSNSLFLIAGDGPERVALERRAGEVGVSGRVRWLGWQANLEDFYHSLDVVLFNSDFDAQARTPLEGMANGIPIVASLLEGGTNEVICSPSVGTLFPVHDHDALAREVTRLLLDGRLAATIGGRGRERIRDYGSPGRHAQRMLEALNLRAPGAGGTAA
ncbi:MAG TPA: glycosyltransferase family 4 protein [Verrucomicrobiae bacterium]